MRYAIWDKQTSICTPVGNVYTPEEWMAKHPAAADPDMVVLCAPGKVNGAIFDLLDAIVNRYEEMGADFSECVTPEDKLAVIEAFDAEQQEAQDYTVSDQTRIADALEDLVILNMPDEE